MLDCLSDEPDLKIENSIFMDGVDRGIIVLEQLVGMLWRLQMNGIIYKILVSKYAPVGPSSS